MSFQIRKVTFLFPLEHSSSKPQCFVAVFFPAYRSPQRPQLQIPTSLCFTEDLRNPSQWVSAMDAGGLALEAQELVLRVINSVLFLSCWEVLGQVTLHASGCRYGMEVMG